MTSLDNNTKKRKRSSAKDWPPTSAQKKSLVPYKKPQQEVSKRLCVQKKNKPYVKTAGSKQEKKSDSAAEEEDLTLLQWRAVIPMILRDDWKELLEFLEKMKDPKDCLALLESTDDDGYGLTWWALKYYSARCYNGLTRLKEKMSKKKKL